MRLQNHLSKKSRKEIVLSRFELLSPAPKAGMIDHYTTGLSNLHYTSHIHIFFLRLQTTQRAKYIRIKNIDERDEKDE